MHDYLDRGYGACVLADSECRDAVESALEYFNGSRYVLHAYVVMANHVHVLMEIAAMDDYVSVLHSWKSYTANIINRLCGTSGPVWRKESYDRIIRNARHYDRVVEYIVKKNAKGRMETRKMRVLPECDVRGGMVKRASSAFTGGGGETRKMRVLPEGDVRGGMVKRASSAFEGGEARKMRVLPEGDVRGGVVKRASSAFAEGGETRKMRVLSEGVLGGILWCAKQSSIATCEMKGVRAD